MNVFNRVVVVLLLLVLLAAVGVGALLPAASLATLRYVVDSAQPLAYAPTIYIWWAVAAALAVLAIVLLVLELRRPRLLMVQVRQASGGMVELSTESVARSLEYHIGQVPGVTGVRPKVESRGKAVRIALELETDPLVDVPAKSEEVVQLACELVEGKLGLKMAPGSLRVTVRQSAYSEGSAAAAPVRPPEPAPDVLAEAAADAPAGLPGDAPAQDAAS